MESVREQWQIESAAPCPGAEQIRRWRHDVGRARVSQHAVNARTGGKSFAAE